MPHIKSAHGIPPFGPSISDGALLAAQTAELGGGAFRRVRRVLISPVAILPIIMARPMASAGLISPRGPLGIERLTIDGQDFFVGDHIAFEVCKVLVKISNGLSLH